MDAGTCPTWDQSQAETGGALRSLKAPGSLGSTLVAPPGPTLHHQPSLPHGTACAVLGKAEIVPSIFWADMDNPQLSTGEDLGTGPWIWWGGIGSWWLGQQDPRGGQEGCLGGLV